MATTRTTRQTAPSKPRQGKARKGRAGRGRGGTAARMRGFEPTTARAQRAVVLATLVLSGVLYWRPGLDNFDGIKFTVVLLGAGLLGALAVGRAVAAGRLTLPLTPVAWAACAFVVAMALSTAASEQPVAALFGVHRRYAGFLLYASLAALLLAVLRLFDQRSVRAVVVAAAVSGTLVACYGVLQLIGADPLGWNDEYGASVFSTMGNPNFAAGYLAICLPAICWVAFLRRSSLALRVAGALLVLLVLLVIAGTRSDQGFAAAAAGLAVPLLAWLLGLQPSRRRLGVGALGGVSVLGFVVLVAGLLGSGPLARLSTQTSFALRNAYWRAALTMFADRPLVGVGPDRYGVNYRTARPLGAALDVGLPQGNDAAHNVALHLLATGGVLVAVAYAAVVGCTGWALISGLRRLRGEHRLLLGALGGCWMAYQVQALVSIDVPGLAAAHWILAGAVVVVAAPPRLREVVLPRRQAVQDRRRPAQRGVRVAVGVTGALVLVVCWASTVPLRADTAAGTASRRGQLDDIPGALIALENANRLAPWEFTYHFDRGDWLLEDGRLGAGLAAFDEAIQRAPDDLKPVLAAARTADLLEQHEVAASRYRRALEIEPQHPDLKVEFAQQLVERGEVEEATGLLEAALDVDPDHEQARELLSGVGG